MNIDELKEIWEQVLGIANLDITKRFYEIGGNSITLLIILDEVNKKTGVTMDVSDMNRFDSVVNMYEYLTSKMQQEA